MHESYTHDDDEDTEKLNCMAKTLSLTGNVGNGSGSRRALNQGPV